jgi:hypothetical protein
MWHGSRRHVAWQQEACGMAAGGMWHGSRRCVAWQQEVCGMAAGGVWHGSRRHVAWQQEACGMAAGGESNKHACGMHLKLESVPARSASLAARVSSLLSCSASQLSVSSRGAAQLLLAPSTLYYSSRVLLDLSCCCSSAFSFVPFGGNREDTLEIRSATVRTRMAGGGHSPLRATTAEIGGGFSEDPQTDKDGCTPWRATTAGAGTLNVGRCGWA